jgi:phytoene dehydrogenase-like protein
MLSESLVNRLRSLGGKVRLGDGATQIVRESGTVRGVRLESGDTLVAPNVVAACHVMTTMDLLGDDAAVDAARARLRVGNGLGMVVRLVTDRLPSYDGATGTRPESGLEHDGMQLLARSRAQLRAAYADFLAGRPPVDPPLLVMTPTATDASLAPAGRHLLTVWTQWHPYAPATGDWDTLRDAEADRLVAALDRWAPGMSAAVIDRWVQTPLDLERELGLRHANVMHVEMTLDAMFALRPLPEWSGYRGPVRGLYLTGASTHPGGGVWGASGRSAAEAVLADRHRGRGRIRAR